MRLAVDFVGGSIVNLWRQNSPPERREPFFLRRQQMLGILVACLILLGAGAAGAAPLSVSSVPLKLRSWRHEIRVLGRIRTLDQDEVLAPFDGRVKHLLERPGSRVRSDQILMALVPQDLDRKIMQAKAQRVYAEHHLHLVHILLHERLQSRQQLEQARLGLQVANQQLDILERRLALGEVRAPFSGTVSYLVAPGALVHTRDPVARISGSGRLWVEVQVTPSQSRELRAGFHATLIEGGQDIHANVYSVGTSADDSGLVPVYLTFRGTPELMAGEVVQVFLSGVAHQAFRVPLEALVLHGSQTRIYLMVHGRAQAVTVKVLHIQSGEAWIQGSFPADARVIVQGSGWVRPGTPVRENSAPGADH
ncbi:MAG: efflux RND transporter periplasmic adaptor subunit [Proteobacteria bacterium]|nr:efflux RND transporter periplasmic adaptor subunit [Pseudomonadota bacterium]